MEISDKPRLWFSGPSARVPRERYTRPHVRKSIVRNVYNWYHLLPSRSVLFVVVVESGSNWPITSYGAHRVFLSDNIGVSAVRFRVADARGILINADTMKVNRNNCNVFPNDIKLQTHPRGAKSDRYIRKWLKTARIEMNVLKVEVVF